MKEIGKLVVTVDFDSGDFGNINFDSGGLKIKLNPNEVLQVINPYTIGLFVSAIRNAVEQGEARILVPKNHARRIQGAE